MAQRISRLKKTVIITSVAALSLVGAGAAFAYWTSTGTGDGTATTGEPVAFEITADAAVGDLAPGSDGQTIAFTVTNPGPGTLLLGLVTVAIADAAGVPWAPPLGCLPEDYTASISTVPTLGPLAGGTSVDGEATVTLANTTSNQDACQGLDVPLHFVAISDTPV